MRTVYLFRHGEPVSAAEHRCLGQRSDPPLSERGSAAAKVLSAPQITAVASSPLLRCTQTAALLFPDAPLTVLPGLAELDCGDWDGLTFDDIRARWPEHYARRGLDPTLPPPGGEAPDAAAARAEAALRDFLARTEGDVAAVSHSGVLRALLCTLTGTPLARHRDISQPYLCMDLLRFDGSRFTVNGLGLTAF